MKKIIVIINILIIILTAFSGVSVATNEPTIYSEGAILIEASTGTVLYEKNSNEKIYPASTTKILTAIIALEQCNLSEKAVASKNALNTIPSNYAIADIRVGEELTLEQLLNVMLIHSANEAANIIAEHISGSTEKFANLMNKKAREIGCKNSNFVNANGIHDDNHYSTASDMALIMQYCLKNDEFRKIIATQKYSLPITEYCDYERTFKNNNSLIDKSDKYYYEYCIGGKTGYTKEAKNSLVSASTKDGMELISVVLKGENTETGESARNADTINLFKYGYENYNLTTIKKKGDKLSSVKVKKSDGETEEIEVELENDISVLNSTNSEIKNVEPKIRLNIDSTPVEEGEVIGTATYSINGKDYSSNILSTETITEDIETVKNFNTFNTIIICATILGLVIIFTVIRKVNISRRKVRVNRYRYIEKANVRRRGKGKHAL